MISKKIVRRSLIALFSILLISLLYGLYMFNMPHRNVQGSKTDIQISVADLVKEYLTDQEAANAKYLSSDGDSKILEVTGTVNRIAEDYQQIKLVILKEEGAKAGIRCSFTPETQEAVKALAPGASVTIKGVIRSGAGYDADIDLYEDAILEKCQLINK